MLLCEDLSWLPPPRDLYASSFWQTFTYWMENRIYLLCQPWSINDDCLESGLWDTVRSILESLAGSWGGVVSGLYVKIDDWCVIWIRKSSMSVRELFPRQVDKKSRDHQGERGLEFSMRKKGQTCFFPLHSLRLYNNNISYLRTVSGLNLLANSVILKCKLWE